MFNHTKTFKRPDGTQYKIRIDYYSTFRHGIEYIVASMLIKRPNTRKWLPLRDTDTDRPTNKEIYETKLELWHQLKPKGEKDV